MPLFRRERLATNSLSHGKAIELDLNQNNTILTCYLTANFSAPHSKKKPLILFREIIDSYYESQAGRKNKLCGLNTEHFNAKVGGADSDTVIHA